MLYKSSRGGDFNHLFVQCIEEVELLDCSLCRQIYIIYGCNCCNLYSLPYNISSKKHKEMQLWHELWLFLFCIFVIGVVSQTVFPSLNMGVTDGGHFFINAYYPPKTAPNFISFKTLRLFLLANASVAEWNSVSKLNLFGNFLLFIPIGALFPMAFPNHSRFRFVFLCMICGILFIEFLQYFCGRVADIDDVLLNMLGISLGYCAFKLCKRIYKKKNV